jgi:hypothetical protein
MILTFFLGSAQTDFEKTSTEWRVYKTFKSKEDLKVEVTKDYIKKGLNGVPKELEKMTNRMPIEIETINENAYWKSTNTAKVEITYGLRMVVSQLWEKYERPEILEKQIPDEDKLYNLWETSKEFSTTAKEFWDDSKVIELVPIEIIPEVNDTVIIAPKDTVITEIIKEIK